MRKPITYPVDGSAMVRLWPDGPRWNSAVRLDAQTVDGADIHVWRCTTTDFENNPVVYIVTVVWPHVWAKESPVVCSGYLWTKEKPVSPRDALILTMADIGELRAGRITADAIIDAREPASPGEGN